MSARDDGPAFPLAAEGPNAPHFAPGMTLRDYFAAAVMQSPVMVRAVQETPVREGATLGQHIAEIAYAIAQRMLAERAKAEAK